MRKFLIFVFIFIVYSMSGANPYKDSLTLYNANMEYVSFFMKKVKPLLDAKRATEASELWNEKLREPISEELKSAYHNLINYNGKAPLPYKVDTYKCEDLRNETDIKVKYYKRPTLPKEEREMERIGSRRNYKSIEKDNQEYYSRQ